MFDIHSITLNNFRSYYREHSFDFPKEYGLYYLTAENKDQPKLESNGSGKSTFLDAITWALYGKTTRGLKAGEIVSWGEKTCVVSLKITVGDRTFTIKRAQKPNGIWVDGTPIDQDALQKLIVLNYESFLYSVMHSQFGSSFLPLSPAEKLTLFSDLLALDFWTSKSDLAAKYLNGLSKKLTELHNLKSYYKHTLENLEVEILHYRDKRTQFERQRNQELKELNDKLKATVKKAPEVPLELYDNLRVKEHNRDIYLENMQQAATDKATAKAEMQVAENHYERFGRLGGFCTICNQTIDKKHAAKHRNDLLHTVNRLIKVFEGQVKRYEDNKNALFKINLDIDQTIDEINNFKFEIEEFKKEKVKMDNLRESYFRVKDQKNPYEELLVEKAEFKNTLEENQLDNNNDIETCQHDMTALEYWVKGFKSIRLYIIENAFRTLELEVNNSLAQLGMEDWSITFDVERENKSGGITKGFVVFVKGPANREPVRWENWSGGESQRLQLAASIGLANLIMQQNGLNGIVEFWDEPSSHMTTGGVVDLVGLLSERAHNETRKVWIVDHIAAANFSEFTGIVTVKKDKNGSSLV